MGKFYVTTPVYYVNAQPHIGHTYTTVAADILARYHRMIGDSTFFATGTDEHGAKIEQKAKTAGKEPMEFSNEVAAKFQFAWDELNISHNRFIRTTDKNHIKAVQNALQYMYDKGDIYKDNYEGLYCVGCEQFKSEKDLVNGKCPDHKIVPEKMSEETYVFRMSKYSDKLLKMIESDELKIRPQTRKNEVVSFYNKEGLKDVSFSRQNVKWGIPLPWDKTHTAYVWADAFLNYLTILNWTGKGKFIPSPYANPTEIQAQSGKEGEDAQFWPADVQLMSKDILRVHATIWPAMLLSLDMPVQKSIFVHGFFLIDGEKMSKSIGNVIAPEELVKRYGVDGTRYLLMSATSFGHDGDISWEKFNDKYNADLANGLGNLLARSVTLVEKMRANGMDMSKRAERPKDKEKLKDWGGLKFDKEIAEMWKNYQNALKEIKIDKALNIIIKQQKYLDNYITENKPWAMIKDKNKEVGVIMYNILERLRHIAIMLWPFLPDTAEKICLSLGLDSNNELSLSLDKKNSFGLLRADTKVVKNPALFPRLN